MEVPPRRQLTRLDAAGAFCPIAFSQANYTVETTWLDPDPSVMVWREERNFEPWRSHAWTSFSSGTPFVSERYSPWQLLYLQDAMDLGRAVVPADILEQPEALAAYSADAMSRRHQQGTLDERWRPFIKLLVALQTRFWAFRRQRTTLLHPDHDMHREAVDPVGIEAGRFDPHGVLIAFGLDLDALARLHAEVALAAMRLDPAPRWHRLAENAPRKFTDELRGEALRARDLYDGCFLLRLLYESATHHWLPRPDEIEDVPNTVQAARRQHLPRADDQRYGYGRADLRKALEREGLYPHRIQFVVEGESEEIMLNRLLEALGCGAGAGYRVTNLRGVDKARQHQELFAAASEYAARTVLIADAEGTLLTTLRQLQREGLLTDEEDILLWEIDGRASSFEEANFTADEIAAAIVAAAHERAPDLAVEITGAELKAAYDDAVRRAEERGDDRPALGKVIVKHVLDAHHLRVSKTELARELAEATIRRIDDAGSLYDAADATRPLLQRLWHWVRESG